MEKALKPDYILSGVNLLRRKFEGFDIDILFNNINYELLYLRFFNLKRHSPGYNDKVLKIEKELNNIKNEIIEKGYVIPKGISKVFKASGWGDELIIKNDDGDVIDRIKTNKNKDGISIADFVGDDDYVGLSSVSIFVDIEVLEELKREKNLAKVYMISSVAIMMAEAFTEVLDWHIKKDMGVMVYDKPENLYKKRRIGIRYSPGYPGLDISVNKNIHKLLNALEIGSTITSSYMIDPESSVQSVVIHNPKAFYF